MRLTTLICLLSLSACVTTVEGLPHNDNVAEGPWLEPSPVLAAKIDDQAERLPWSHGQERVEQIQWFAGVGEPAYGTLLALAADPRADVAGSALAALGATGDSRLVPHVRELPPIRGDAPLRLERARTLVRLGDWEELPVLIDGLRSQELFTRALCGRTLYQATGEDFGFHASDEEDAREPAVLRWEQWWRERAGDAVLMPQEAALPTPGS